MKGSSRHYLTVSHCLHESIVNEKIDAILRNHPIGNIDYCESGRCGTVCGSEADDLSDEKAWKQSKEGENDIGFVYI